MPIPTPGAPLHDREALLRVVMAKGLIDEAGGQALREYYAGRRIVAYEILRRKWRGPPPASILAVLEDRSLWVEAPVGAGARSLRPSGLPPLDGFDVVTHWSRTLGFPTAPTANYLVHPTDPSTLVASIPLTPGQRASGSRRQRGIFGGVATAALVVFGVYTPHQLVVYNGFPVPIVVTVGEASLELGPSEHRREDVYGWRTHVGARTHDGVQIDDVDVAFSWGRVVYTPGRQAALGNEDIVYGSGEADAPVLLALDAVQVVDADYFFDAAPQSLRLERGANSTHRHRVYNVLTDEFDTAVDRANFLAEQFGMDAASEVLRTSLRVAPDQFEVADVLDAVLEQDRPQFWQDLHARAPSSLEIWRRTSEVSNDRPAFLQAVRAAKPGEGDAAALVRWRVMIGLLTPDPAEALASAEGVGGAAASEARADALGRLGRWADAQAAWERGLASGLDPTLALREWRRARWLGEQPLPGVLADAPPGDPGAADAPVADGAPDAPVTEALPLGDHERFYVDVAEVWGARGDEGARSRLQAASAHLAQAYAEPAEARYRLALAAGGLTGARLALNDMKGTISDRAYRLDALRIELSEGGDRTGLAVLLGVPAYLPAGWVRVAALAAVALRTPGAEGWAALAAADGDGGPSLAELREVAAGPATQASLAAWAPRYWPLAALGCAWIDEAEGRASARDAWFRLAHAVALPAEIMASPLPALEPL